MHIHIIGASGSGTTTLGQALAGTLALRHLDTDNYYWLPTSPPFKRTREPKDRLLLLRRDLSAGPGAVVSGSVVGWGPEVEDSFALIVFLYLPTELRLARLRRRELERYGQVDQAFLQWASEYDRGPSAGRSLARHEAWLAQRSCPVLLLEGDLSVDERVQRVVQAMPNPSQRLPTSSITVCDRYSLLTLLLALA